MTRRRTRHAVLAAAVVAAVSWILWFVLVRKPGDGLLLHMFPPGAAAALLDGRPHGSGEGPTDGRVICLSVEGARLDQILALRRHDQRKVVNPDQCMVDAAAAVRHRPSGAPAALVRFSEFRVTGNETGTARVEIRCGPGCDSTRTVVLNGADDIGWWVVEEKNAAANE